MPTKLWEKNIAVNEVIERFTVGHDRELDLYLAKYDVLGSMAHITMLEHIASSVATSSTPCLPSCAPFMPRPKPGVSPSKRVSRTSTRKSS